MGAGGLVACGPIGPEDERHVAVGDQRNRALVLEDHHRPDVAVAHQAGHFGERGVGRRGHDGRGHHLSNSHAGECTWSE